MRYLLIGAVAMLSFANGANDNFKGVATLWGAGRTTYKRALAWATIFTFLGSLAAVLLADGLAAKFNGSNIVTKDIYTQLPFLGAIMLAATGTVLLASWLGLPISTTHALVGSLLGAGVTAAGMANVHFGALGRGVVLPLLFSPVVALLLTFAVYPLVQKLSASHDCVCVDAPMTLAGATNGAFSAAITPDLRWANSTECEAGTEIVRLNFADGLHWFSGATISFGRGLNDTPKIAAVLLVAGAAPRFDYASVATLIAVGGILGAARVAQTMGKQITPMTTHEAVTANLVAAALVMLASHFALPVSTTHVTTGGILGIGLLRRREANWRRVRDIVIAWFVTLPMAAVLAPGAYWLLTR